jgi:hypothetical protein
VELADLTFDFNGDQVPYGYTDRVIWMRSRRDVWFTRVRLIGECLFDNSSSAYH